MRIIMVSPLPPPMGGIATLTESIMNKLSSSTMEFKCINIAHKVNRNNNHITKYSKLESLFILFRTLLKISYFCFHSQYDVIHINSSSGDGTIRDYLIECLANLFKIPVILHYHCNLHDAVSQSEIAKLLFGKCLKHASKIIVLNKNSQEYVHNQGYDSFLVPNGLREDLIVQKQKVNETIKRCIFTGRVSVDKGCVEIFECAKANPQIDFYFAGLIEKEIEEKLKSLTNVKLLGVLSQVELIKELDASDIFIFPTYSEGFSMSLLEAMARGLPCVTTDVGANKDMIEDKGGVLAEVKNAMSVIEALQKITKPEIRKSMSEWNIQKVTREYTENKMFARLIDIYKRKN